MIIRSRKLFSFAFTLLFIPLFVGLCSRKPDTCHQSIRIVNNSERTVFIGMPGYYNKPDGTQEVWLHDCCEPISPNNSVDIQIISFHCLEEYYTPMSLYVLPESSSGISTTEDSLSFVYAILKTIDLQALGVDSLVETDYTVYYP